MDYRSATIESTAGLLLLAITAYTTLNTLLLKASQNTILLSNNGDTGAALALILSTSQSVLG